MSEPTPGTFGNRWHRCAAVAVAMVLAVGCSARGEDAGERPVTEDPTTSTTTTTDDRSADETPPTTNEDPADPEADDVADDVFAGQGDPRIDVEHYEVELSADPGAPEIQGTATITLRPATAAPLDDFTLDLNGPVVSDASIDGTDVVIAESPEDDGEIVLTPAAALAPGEPIDLRLTYGGAPEPTTFPDLGVPVGWQPDDEGGWFTMSEPDGTSTWVPVSEHPSDKATWTVTLDTPSDAVGVANGRLTARAETEGRRQWTWETDEPMASYLVFAAVGAYDLVERPGPGDTEAVFAFPPSVGDEDRANFEELDEIMAFYAESFGGYPDDDTGAVVVATDLRLALETQTRPLFGLDALGGDKVGALAHELAHEWYGNAVSPATWEDLWLNESFATYADWLYQDETGGRSIRANADRAVDISDLAVLDPDAAATFDPVIYDGGARALYALRLTVGDEDFAEILERWFTDNDGTSVTTDDFVALAEEVSGQDLEAFVQDWLRSTDQPDLPG